jgi:hypothetical protein
VRDATGQSLLEYAIAVAGLSLLVIACAYWLVPVILRLWAGMSAFPR